MRCQPEKMNVVYRSAHWLQQWLLPVHCRLCGTADAQSGLCTPCRDELPWLVAACRRCGVPLASSQHDPLCGRCQHKPPPFDSTTALFHYRPPVDYLIQRLKFAGELAITPLLAGLMARHLAGRAEPLPARLLPVPLHPKRLRERGYNQSGELARSLGRRLAIPVDQRCCRRLRHTEPQSQLPLRARQLNLRNAFSVRSGTVSGHVAVIDDVMTTGHTVAELARTLKRAGAEQVEIWVIARTGYRGGPA